jgi:hypothetical protein
VNYLSGDDHNTAGPELNEAMQDLPRIHDDRTAIPASYSPGTVAEVITKEVFAFPMCDKTP